MVEGVFAGIRVLELGQYGAAPYGGELPANGGADVIKVEPIGDETDRLIAAGVVGDREHSPFR